MFSCASSIFVGIMHLTHQSEKTNEIKTGRRDQARQDRNLSRTERREYLENEVRRIIEAIHEIITEDMAKSAAARIVDILKVEI